ncbi:hypothetical protein ACFQ1S_26780 [Kibdelosporangium lantanae]|uniref:Uncharacterized protein n=1 Tax=Kibdelosporangium lantanae TaxID=1497396 RepID=A0ABW3MH31_9PSEU
MSATARPGIGAEHGSIERHTKHEPAEPAIQRKNLRNAVLQIAQHLAAYPTLTAQQMVITNIVTSPPPPLPTVAGSHFPPWHSFDAAVCCATVLDVANWCGTISGLHSLSVCVTDEGAQLKLVGWIGTGEITVTADAGWLAHAMGLHAGQNCPVSLRALTTRLEAYVRRSRAPQSIDAS